jgi:hypothetical protein
MAPGAEHRSHLWGGSRRCPQDTAADNRCDGGIYFHNIFRTLLPFSAANGEHSMVANGYQ